MKDRIRKLCPELQPSMIDDFANIAALLARPTPALIPYLANLEHSLQDEMTSQHLFDDPTCQTILFNPQHGKRFKILTNVLMAWAAENGFHPSLAKINYYLPPRVFRNMQAGGYLFNDKGSSLEHGEWTHSIQWYLITEANKHHPFLVNQPADLYIAFSKNDHRSKLWNMIFDVSAQHTNLASDDFRCPGNVHAHLMSEAAKQQYSILHAIVSKQEVRMAKRAISAERRPDVEIRSNQPRL